MKRTTVIALAGAITIGVVIGVPTGAFLWAALSPREQPAPAKPPNVAGQPVPDTFLAIDFTKRHDLRCGDLRGAPTYRHCKILGFTGQKDAGAAGGDNNRPRYSHPGEYFNNWLVLEMEDGRLAYIPPQSVLAIEASGP